jgi:2-polyprenyl-6-methoxyphenol hydroxylase-like FAD-dependent oxidoreductase
MIYDVAIIGGGVAGAATAVGFTVGGPSVVLFQTVSPGSGTINASQLNGDTISNTSGLNQIPIGQGSAKVTWKSVGGDATQNASGTMTNTGMQGVPVVSGGTDAQL